MEARLAEVQDLFQSLQVQENRNSQKQGITRQAAGTRERVVQP
jgi:hypothetical protein